MLPAVKRTSLLVWGISWCACTGDSIHTFPPGLEPLEANTAAYPAATAESMYPETFTIRAGDAGRYYFAHGSGYIHGSVEQVWDALKDPAVVADRFNTDEQTFMFGVEPEYELSYAIHYVVEDIVTVDWTETWRGDRLVPEEASDAWSTIRYQKTQGTGFITLIEGSVTLFEVESQITGIEVIHHAEATATGEEEVFGAINNTYLSARARVHGEPLPQP
jgi:hypothetical protein